MIEKKERYCPNCGTVSNLKSRFCGECGQELPVILPKEEQNLLEEEAIISPVQEKIKPVEPIKDIVVKEEVLTEPAEENITVVEEGEKDNSGIVNYLRQEFSGREGRWSYFKTSFKAGIIGGIGGYLTTTGIGAILGIPLIVIAILINTAALVRRLHDLGVSGWWIMGMFIPYIRGLFLLIVLFVKGSNGDNKYGPPQV